MMSLSSLPLLLLAVLVLLAAHTCSGRSPAFGVGVKSTSSSSNPGAAAPPSALFQSNAAAAAQPVSQFHFASSSFSSERTARTTTAQTTKTKDMTLYEILGASPNDSRSQLKKRYLALAKESHPDALLAKQPQQVPSTTVHDFHQVTQAWSILGDPKLRQQYDRDLSAQVFTQSIAASAEFCFVVLEGMASFLWRCVSEHHQQQQQHANRHQ